MPSAKDIVIKPISAKAANALVKRVHYSGKVVNNSKLHLGAFLGDSLEGAMSFGSPLDKRKVLPLVEGTAWNGMLELNRMAFSEALPRNSESRALSVAFRLIRKHYPHIEWVLSFADGTQCGDGAIYRAAGFVLSGIKENSDCMMTERSGVVHTMTVKSSKRLMSKYGNWKKAMLGEHGKFEPTKGYQLRYIYFLNPEARKRLTVPILPFSKIDEMGAGMYKGKPKRDKQAMTATSGTAAGQHRPSRSNSEAA